MKRFILSLLLAFGILFVLPPMANLASNSAITSNANAGAYSAGLHVKTPFVRGRLICAINVSKDLQRVGISVQTTWSSRDFLRYPRVSQSAARAHDVRFNYRRGGGHVMTVIGRSHGVLMCKNPSASRQHWVVKRCPPGGIYVRPSAGRHHIKTHHRSVKRGHHRHRKHRRG